jgi:large conductance mechanosensitive channel
MGAPPRDNSPSSLIAGEQSSKEAVIMALVKEFVAFIKRGNVLDLAVAVIIAGAFGKIVSSFVADILMPPIGLLIGGVNFIALKLRIGGTPETPVTINYGTFLQATFDFLIIAFVIFIIIKAINGMKKKEAEAPPPAPSNEEVLLTEIRDILKAQK